MIYHGLARLTGSAACKIIDVGCQRLGNALKNQQRRVTDTPLNAAEIGLVHIRQRGQFLLRKAPGAPQALHVETDSFANVHAAWRLWTSALTIDYKS